MTYRTKAIVLKSIPWPRNARMFILYTEYFGKIKCVGSGIDKITSKVAGHLQPYCLAEVMIARGRNIDRLAQARLLKVHSTILEQFLLSIRGTYILEVINLLTKEGVVDAVIWQTLLDTLEELNEQAEWCNFDQDVHLLARIDLLVRTFTLKMLNRMGYWPELYKCIYCKNLLSPENLHFSVVQGGGVCQMCQSQHPDSVAVNVEVIKYLRATSTHSIKKISLLTLKLEHTTETVNIIDQLLMMQIQRPLNSVLFINTVQNRGILV